MNKTDRISATLNITVLLDQYSEDEIPELMAYVFSKTGRLLATAPLGVDPKKPDTAKADVKVTSMYEQAVVKIATKVTDIHNLAHKHPHITKLALAKDGKIPVQIAVDEAVWSRWLHVPYHVTGTVEKLEQGVHHPICKGTVEIYDVDLYPSILRLPHDVLERIRDGIIDILLDPPPVEITEFPKWHLQPEEDDYCGTGPRPSLPKRIIELTELSTKLQKLPAEWRFASQRASALATARTRMNAELNTMSLHVKQAYLAHEALPTIPISQIMYSTTEQFRTLLADKFLHFRFWLCWYPWLYYIWWPWCRGYTLEKLGTAELQPGGHFSDTIWLSICRHDIPDLWFKVTQNIAGVDRVIYQRFPVPCNTKWNHPSGDPVHLLVTDPEAVACYTPDPVYTDEVYVMPLGIGNDEWYSIHQAHLKPGDAADAQTGLYAGTDPYGTVLNFTQQLHEELRSHGVHYYRWSYRKAGTLAWSPINTPISHRYMTKNSEGHWTIAAEKLGPETHGAQADLFQVRDPHKDWISTDVVYAQWDTTALADAKYQVMLEMFDALGAKITDPASKGFVFVLPTNATGDVDDALYIVNGSLILNLHLDNQPTVADIISVALGGNPAQECQFLEYTDKSSDQVTVTYVAYHPNGFMDHFDLNVYRGISGTLKGTVPAPDNTVPAAAATLKSFSVATLLDSYPQCAFSVGLHTWPRTRNGYDRIRAYERSDVSAFALTLKKAAAPVIL